VSLATARSQFKRFAPLLVFAAVALIVTACAGPGGTPGPGDPTPSPQPPLMPAQPGANPVDLLAWLFTPIFQAFFVTLVLLDQVTDNIAISIILLTILLRIVLIPLYRKQLTSTKRMQLLMPEVKELQRKYKGDRMRAQQAVQEFYKSRGVNPASGCLPILLQMVLIIPMYSVISQGLQNHDVNAMLNVFGVQLLTLACDPEPIYNAANQVINPCMDPFAFGVNWGVPEILFTVVGFGVSGIAILSALFQFVQSRMMLPVSDPKNDDPNTRIQRQMLYFLPLISILYGGILPAGLFLYWIMGTIFSMIQQYLIIGWGGTFPLFGWTPGFARDHTPRFPVSIPQPVPVDPADRKDGRDAKDTKDNKATKPRSAPRSVDREISARSTIRPNRGRSRRGRRR
jgi:YidC/Oxa1 family membrane protein insertase